MASSGKELITRSPSVSATSLKMLKLTVSKPTEIVMRFVIQMGRIYKLTDGMYRQLLKDGMADGVDDLSKYKATQVSFANNITDWSQDDFKNEYENLKSDPSKSRKRKKT